MTRDHIAKRRNLQRRYERIFKADTSDDDDTDNGNGNGERHLIDELADLLVEAGSPDGEVSRESALQWLLHSRNGQAFVSRMAQARKRTNKGDIMTNKEDTAVTLAKAFVDSGGSFLTESQLTEKINEYAQLSRQSGESLHQAFARVFAGNTAEAKLFRQAVAICKARDMFGNPPVQDSDEDVADEDRDNDDDDDRDDDAMDKLSAKAARLRETHPDLTPEQAFAKVYQDPANRLLVKRERRANGYVFAR
jgi:hypothetical protein